MSVYAIPSFINLVIKLWLFWHGRQSFLNKNRLLGLLLLSFFLLNLAEFISFCLMAYPQYLEIIGRVYYVTAIFFVMTMLTYADQLTYRKIHWSFSMIVALNLMIFILFSDNLIAGVTSIGYIITRIPGPYYWVIQFYVLSCVIGSVILLYLGSRNLEDQQQRKVCKLMCGAFLPIVIIVVYVVSMMAIGAKLNAAIYLTSAITVFLLIIIYAEINNNLMNILTITPMFGVKITASFYRAVLNIFKGQSIDLRSLIRELEDILIVSALELCDGRRQDAACMLRIPQSTFNEKLRKIKNINPTLSA